jgi:hypothetical protein
VVSEARKPILSSIISNDEPGIVFGDDERADALVAGIRIGLGRHDDQAAILAAGNEPLGTVDDIMIAVFDRRGLLADRVGSGFRLGQGKCADIFPMARSLR